MKLYKLTDQDGFTRRGNLNEIKWEAGLTFNKPHCNNPQFCSSDVIHAYKNPNLAFILNCIHANIENPQLWEVEGDIVRDDWDKVGCFDITVIKKIETPKWYKEYPYNVQIWFAILCLETILKLYEIKYSGSNSIRYLEKVIFLAKENLKNKFSSQNDLIEAWIKVEEELTFAYPVWWKSKISEWLNLESKTKSWYRLWAPVVAVWTSIIIESHELGCWATISGPGKPILDLTELFNGLIDKAVELNNENME